jgi:hypothetical protein
MKPLRTLSPAGFLVLLLLRTCFSAGTTSGQDSKGSPRSWDNLKSLTPGQEVRVVMKNVLSYRGKFESLSDGGITLRQAAREQTLSRKDILRVSLKTGQDHQVRNMLIGMVVGAGAGVVIGLGPYYVHRNCTEGPLFNCGSPPNARWVKVLTPVGGVAGMAIGAWIPTGGWYDIYRAH